MPTANQGLARLIPLQPDVSSREEVVRELAVRILMKRGPGDSDAKRALSNADMT
jgi:hypothetical protein